MPQIYDTPQGPSLLVRDEDRGQGREYLFAHVDHEHRVIAYVWHTTLPEDYTLIHDPVCRAEAEIITAENGALIREKAVLLECLASALGQLPERSADEVRDIYRAKIKTADLISLTKPSDLVGTSKGE